MEEPLSEAVEKYKEAMHSVIMAMRIIVSHDLDDILLAIERANNIGPLIDPTLWIKKSEDMNYDKKMIESAIPLWKMARSLMDKNDD